MAREPASTRVRGGRRGSRRCAWLTLASLGALLVSSSAQGAFPVSAGGRAGAEGQHTAIDEDGNVYVAGTFRGSAAFGTQQLFSAGDTDVYVAKYDAIGNLLWAVSGGGTGADQIGGVALDESQNTYLTGSFRGSASFGGFSLGSGGQEDVFVAKLDADGDWQWAVKAGSSGADLGRAIATSPQGVFVGGSCSGTASFGPGIDVLCSGAGFVARLDEDGVIVFAETIGSGSGASVTALAMTRSGQLYVAGEFQTSMQVDFGTTPATFAVFEPESPPDSFLARMSPLNVDVGGDPDPFWNWAEALPGPVVVHAIAVDPFANLHVGGEVTEANVQIGGLPALPSAGAFVARLHDGGFVFEWQWVQGAEGGMVNGIALEADGGVMVTGSFGDSGLRTLSIGPAAEGGVADLFSESVLPRNLVLDLAGGRLYWLQGAEIRRGNLDGTGAVTLVSPGFTPSGLAVDPVGGKIYWSNFSANQILRANLDGSGQELARSIDFGGPRTLAVDAAAGQLYWSQNNGSIWRADVGDPPSSLNNELLLTGIVSSSQFGLDLVNGRIYYTDESLGGSDEIWRANLLDGSGQELILDVGGDSPANLLIDAAAGRFYWSTPRQVKRAALDGTGVVDVVVADADLGGVAVDLGAQQIYLSKQAVPDLEFVIQRSPIVASITLREPFGFLFDAADNLVAGNTVPVGVVRFEGGSGSFGFLDSLVEIPDASSGVQSLNRPSELAFGPDGRLYVTSRNNYSSGVGDFDYVVVYDPQTGAEVETLPNTFAQGAMDEPEYLAFAPDGSLFVSERNRGVRRWGAGGVECGEAAQPACPSGGGLSQPKGLAFGADGLLYVASHGSDAILRYQHDTGAFVDAFVPAGSSQLDGPTDLAFGPDGDLYVVSDVTKDVLRFDGATGDFVEVLVGAGESGLQGPRSLGFGPDGTVYVSDAFDDVIRRYTFEEATATMTLGSIVLQSSGHRDLFVARLVGGSDPAAVSWDWATAAGGSEEDVASSIVVASPGVYYVTGSFRDESSFGELSLESEATGPANVFLARIECAGEWARFHRWVSGQPVSPPSCTPALIPEIEIPGLSLVEAQSYFFWSVDDNALYAVRPVDSAFVKWRVSSDLADDTRIVHNGELVWPESVQIHVAGAPADLEPDAAGLTYNSMLYSENEASDDQKVYGAALEGHSVLLYGAAAPPFHRFEVVRTVRWDHPDHRVDAVAVIGEEIVESSHDDPSGRNGYVLATGDPRLVPRSTYDGTGPERAYDRAARSGPIIPVNENERAGEDLVVAWYQVNPRGVAWPVRPVHYDTVWPPSPLQIIIASEQGSEIGGQPILDASTFPSKRIYAQPVRGAPGFNPNDEHALFAPSNTGTGKEALFALRSDLDAGSEPYVLLKYWDEPRAQWAFEVYAVHATGLGFDSLSYPGLAGTQVEPPYPLRLQGACPESFASDDLPFWQDYRGTVWARAAGGMTVHYFYPLREDFYYDLDGDGGPDGEAGDCVAWLDLLPGGTPGVPFPVDYAVAWPPSVPTLSVGETLLGSKRGLPDVVHQAAVEIAFDELSPETPDPTASLAQLLDPLSPRSVPLDALPPDVASRNDLGKRRILGNASGTIRLPFALSSRILFDPLNNALSFEGLLDESGAGEPLLLLNVMTSEERDLLESLSGDVGFHTAIDALYDLTRNPRRLDLDGDGEPDPDLLVGLRDIVVDEQGSLVLDEDGAPLRDGVPESFAVLGVPGALSAGAAAGTGYLTLAFNNHESLAPLPVSLSVLRVGCAGTGSCSATTSLACSWDGDCPASESCQLSQGPSPYQGEVKVIESDDVFDEQLTLRHSGDFGGDPGRLTFEWFTHPDLDGTPPPPPPDPDLGVLDGWERMSLPTPGLLEVTIGGSNLQALSDNWYFARYTGYPVCDNATVGGMPSGWAGAPGGTLLDPQAQLGDGWIKRVVLGLNPFEARVDDFHAAPTNTYGSMIVQLGERYEGDIAFNGDPANLNQLGLIEAYETVLRRGLSLTTQGTPPVDYGPANAQLLLVASRIADFYVLLANEAFADAADPTIGLGTDSSLGALAPAIFTFQNQLESLLDEELTLLRGRDDTGAPTAAPPVYNRLFWNFTSGEGEVAYSQAYAISDQDSDGFIDESDARILFPQGHGDAWGHYLTAIKTYYRLLRDPFYSWEPRAESVRVAGVPVLVDFLDERKFAAAAAARAQSGAQIVDLTYRREYVEDPGGQWQGYRDTDPERAWGVDEWARRAGQGAYLDWVVANAIVPAQDPDFDPGQDHPIQRVDRSTVLELGEIPSHYEEIQAQLDEADRGLNPLGLAKGVVPFDIDPSLIDGGMTHFDQIYDRARIAMDNALRVFDHANLLSQALRRNQDSVNDLARNASQQERGFRNQLIETFGYPYPDDIGPGGTYPAGYEGPDLYHYMYVDPSELTGARAPVAGATQELFDAYYEPLPGIGFDLPPLLQLVDPLQQQEDEVKVVQYAYSLDETGVLTKPESWAGQRRAPGEIQKAISDLLQNRARFERSIQQHDNLLRRIEDARDLLLAQHGVNANEIFVLSTRAATNVALDAVIIAAKATAGALRTIGNVVGGVGRDVAECLPKTVGVASDVTAPARCSIRTIFSTAGAGFHTSALVAEGVANGAEAAKRAAADVGNIELAVASNEFQVLQRVKEIERLIREEAVLRLEMYTLEEVLKQSAGRYQSTLARGERVLEELIAFRKAAAADTQEHRYQDLAFRIFRNDALQKYRAQFDMAARYAFLAATAYDYETNLLGSSGGAGRRFLTDVVRHRSLGEVLGGEPVAGSRGLADTLARMSQNFDVLRGQLGFNNPQTETNRFSLRSELLRLADGSDADWRAELQRFRVDDLWQVPEFRRLARPFAPESAGPQPGLVIPFETNVTFGLNYFGWPLGGGDSAYDPSHFATKVRSVGVWFADYDLTGLSNTPRVYLLPAGADVLRSPNATDFETREWRVVDQKLPVPFPVGATDLDDPDWIPLHDSLNEDLGAIRQISSFRAFHDSGVFDPSETTADSRLIGRSVWNTRWLLVIPGGTLLADADDGLDTFILGAEVPGSGGARDGAGVSDVLLFFQTYAFSGN